MQNPTEHPRWTTPLKRISYDFCFYGAKGSGKTIAMCYFALFFFLKGYTICANFDLSIPYIRIRNLEDIKQMKNCVFLGDDFEAWASSKFLTNKDKKELLECTLNFGKRNIIFIWSCKRPLEIDKTLRATSIDYFVKCKMLLKNSPVTYKNYIEDSKFLDAHLIEMEVYNSINLKLDRVVYLDNLDVWCKLYRTEEEIQQLE